MSKVGEHLKHKTYVERDETVLEHAVDAHWTEGQSLLSHLPKKEGQALSFVPELAGACVATRCATCWKLSPRSSAQSASIHRKSRYCNSLFPSATLAKMMSALVMLNFLPIKPVSFTSLAHTLMFISTPLPAAKDV